MTGINKANLKEIQRLIEVLDEHITSKVFKLSGGLKILNENNEVLGFISHGDDGWEFSTPINSYVQPTPYGGSLSQQSIRSDPNSQMWYPPPRNSKGGQPLEARSPGTVTSSE